MLTVITGGARSGKSCLAERFAASAGGPVTVIATAEALDADMADRIAAYRVARDQDWDVIEAPVEVAEALGSVTGSTSVVVDYPHSGLPTCSNIPMSRSLSWRGR